MINILYIIIVDNYLKLKKSKLVNKVYINITFIFQKLRVYIIK